MQSFRVAFNTATVLSGGGSLNQLHTEPRASGKLSKNVFERNKNTGMDFAGRHSMLALVDRFGVQLDKFGDSTSQVDLLTV